MLKVLKNDWRNGWNSVKITLLAAAVISILLGIGLGIIGGRPTIGNGSFSITSEENMDTVTMLLTLTWSAVMVALLVLTVDTIVRNMSSRMFGPEGYLTHTLPVEIWELLGGKALGTWLFGVFMVGVAIGSILLVMLTTAVSAIDIGKFVTAIVQMLPKLGTYHFRQMASGIGYVLYGIGAFLVWSLLIVIQYQFICIAARQFGKHHIAGSVIVFCVLIGLEGNLNQVLSMGFLVCLVTSIACFFGSCQLLKKRLNL